jgi:hypothetical protein
MSIPARSLVPWTYTIQPMVSSDEVAARVSDHRHIQVLERINDIFAEPILVRERVAGIVDSYNYVSMSNLLLVVARSYRHRCIVPCA